MNKTQWIPHITGRTIMIGATSMLLLVLFGVALIRLVWQVQVISDELIVHDVMQLAKIFKHIDQDCKIIGFEHERNYIDFLTVKDFVGSEIGAMNVAYPRQWKGAYLNDNPTIQEKLYEIVKTKSGYFIVPGNGVVLNSGKVIGKDIIFSVDTDMKELLKQEASLQHEGKFLIAPVPMSGNTFELVVQEVPLRVSAEQTDDVLSEAENIIRVC